MEIPDSVRFPTNIVNKSTTELSLNSINSKMIDLGNTITTSFYHNLPQTYQSILQNICALS